MFGYPIGELLASARRMPVSTAAVEPLSQQHSPRSMPNAGGSPHATVIPTSIWSPGGTEVSESGEDWRFTSGEEQLTFSDSERIISMAARRALRFGAIADASNVGSESLEQLQGEVSRLAVAYLQEPLSEILGDIVSLQDHIFCLLEGRQRPRETRDLYVVGGLASGMLAKAAHDLRDPQLAMTHARTALLCARNAEHSALLAWVNGIQSLITYWADRPREALQYAQAGQEVPGISGSVGIWLASLEARAWSAVGNGIASTQAIDRAADLRESGAPDDLDGLGGMCYFSRPRQLYYAADAGVSLWTAKGNESQNTRNAEYAAAAVAAYESAAHGERSFSDEARLTVGPGHSPRPRRRHGRSQ